MAFPVRASLIPIVASLGLGGAASAPAVKPAPKAPKAGASAAPTSPSPTPERSAIYYVIRRTEDAWTVMDPNAVEKVSGGPVRRAYSVTVRRNLLNGGPPQPGYVRTLSEYDCSAHQFRWRTFTIYNRFGAVVMKQDNADAAFGPPDTGGEDETMFRVVCDGSGGGSVVAAPSLGRLVIGLMQAWDDAAIAAPLEALAREKALKAAGRLPEARTPETKEAPPMATPTKASPAKARPKP